MKYFIPGLFLGIAGVAILVVGATSAPGNGWPLTPHLPVGLALFFTGVGLIFYAVLKEKPK